MKPSESTTYRPRKQLLQMLSTQQKPSSGVKTLAACELPPNKKSVLITHIVSHREVFLRLKKNDDAFLKYLNDVAECAVTAPPLDETPKKGDIVLADFNGCYYRAVVGGIINDEVIVAFLELGHVEQKPIKMLKKLREDLQMAQRFVFKAILSGVNEGIKTDECLNYLHQLQDKAIPLKFTRTESAASTHGVLCELFVGQTNENVGERLNALNAIKRGKTVTVQVNLIAFQ